MTKYQTFPIHDAHIIAIAILPRTNGSLKVQVDLRIHKDTALAELKPFGLSRRSCRLVFETCWRVTANLFGLYSVNELIDRWQLVQNSDLVRQVKEMGCGASVKFEHNRLTFSGGSTIDILAERSYITNVLTNSKA